MRISYVLPVYNCCEGINNTIDSLLNQKHKDFEIIVIDDCSSDDISYIKDFYDNHYKMKWITKEARGGGALCRNLGNQLADGDIIAVCDAGDIYHEARGEVIEEFFEQFKDASIFYSDVAVVDNYGNVLHTQKATDFLGECKPPVSHPTVAYLSKVGKSIKYHETCLDTDFYEFFMIDCKRKGYVFGFSNNVTCLKLHNTNRDVTKAKDEKYKMYQKYGIKIEREAV